MRAITTETYSLELAEEHIAQLRGDSTVKEEHQEIGALVLDANAGPLGTGQISGPDVWNDTAALANGWSKTGYFKYRLNALGNVEVAANLVVGTITDFTVILSTALPAAYRPTSDQYVPVNTDQARTDANTRPAALLFKTDGTVQCFGIGGTAAHARVALATYPLGL